MPLRNSFAWTAAAILLCVLLRQKVLPAVETELHVSPSGDDDAAGSSERPLATPQHAIDRSAGIARRSREAAVKIVLHAGVYHIETPLVIRRQHVPPQGSLTIRAADGERVVISGGRQIHDWKIEEDGIWSVTLPEVASGDWSFRELFVNGQRRPRARHPNDGYLRIERAFADKRSGFTTGAGDLPETWTAGGELVFLHDWSVSRVPVQSVNHRTRRLTVAFPIGSRADHYRIDHFEPHPRYFVENHRAFFDASGEWLLDEESGVLRYKPLPNESPRKTEVVAPRASVLAIVAGDENKPIRNVHFRGLHFEHCAWQLPAGGYAAGQATAHERRDDSPLQFTRAFIPAALQFERAEDCSFTAGRLAHLGTTAIEFGSRTRRCRLEDSHIEDVSGNGVRLGEDTSRTVDGRPWWRAAPEQAASQLVVAHNRIERCGQQFFGAVAVWAGIGRELQITHNLVAHHPYSGISLGWMWNPTPTPAGENLVARNHIHHVMQVLSDGGGIYTLGRQPGTRLVGNFIHDVPLNAGRAESNGMFLDQGSDGITIADNVIYNTERSSLRFHQAEQMTVRDNTLVVPSAKTPALRYNNTDPNTIEQINNRIVSQLEFDPQRATPPAVGPRDKSSLHAW